MQELRATQNARAASRQMLSGIEIKELKAVRTLARQTWGDHANFFIERPGWMSVGFFDTESDRHLAPLHRAQTVVAVGRTHAEIEAQIRLWKASRT